MMRRGAFLLGAVVVLGACGGGGTSAGGSAAPKTAPTTAGGATQARSGTGPVRGGSNLIVEAEITTSGASNALEVIQKVRPAMLRGRGGSQLSDGAGTEQIQAYVDNIPVGSVTQLAAVGAMNVKEIRYINATDATTRFGTNHAMGAILVTTKGR
jgi:hypothetical protein